MMRQVVSKFYPYEFGKPLRGKQPVCETYHAQPKNTQKRTNPIEPFGVICQDSWDWIQFTSKMEELGKVEDNLSCAIQPLTK